MLKVGIIGLGDIAKKAYLPVLSTRKDIEFHICTRNEKNLIEAANKYRFQQIHTSLDSLLRAEPDCAFVNSATHSHFDIVKLLLQNGIHVYVDKPMTLHFESAKELVEISEANKRILMVGFNRRYAPLYDSLKKMKDPSMIIMQKNRARLPDELRNFVFDDFIHVVDTLRYLFPYPIQELNVTGMKKGYNLHHIMIQFVAPGGEIAIGIMNRDTGLTEEKLEVMNHEEKRVVYNVNDLEIQSDKNTLKVGNNDWQPTLYRRGFDLLIDDFLEAVRTNGQTKISARDALATHELCERIVEKLLN